MEQSEVKTMESIDDIDNRLYTNIRVNPAENGYIVSYEYCEKEDDDKYGSNYESYQYIAKTRDEVNMVITKLLGL